ncbi:helicase C-terminal domain-containing protein [Halobacterium salinarum]|uniref:Helicase domain protein n=4 Tax=Halobacterium salinarum TaxID=2242 RepID=A0A510N9G9_HALSA|nr:ATP-dependent DNA helicase [Halobacterium salinarum]MBB6089517.1 Rad3-related DNA helicase [Halobacterium salinarum]MDL0131726.1 ATP-dependent DNA helicase [Halobacterium salinarum]MDL0141933.1 ATP-dependent DNA helicase [Halobacterium salinarum]UEB91903.1 ATP-dependent DNA helicase [Halobacterium salinarum NRC-34001]CAP14856.1 helicase domain protein [Halobacterium salinarum R1]
MQPGRVVEEFPAPEFRGAQRQALADIQAAFDAGNDVVLVRAPTGSGKSLLARAIMGCARRAADADPSDAVGAYYTTPQVSQLDDVAADDLLEEFKLIRGKSNYTCILPGEEATPVDRAPCARERGYDCAVKHRCPYFADRAIASSRAFAAMTLAYFMRTAGSEVFRKRDVCVIDEAHGLAEWAEMYATIDLDEQRVPVWEDVRVPSGLDGDPERTADFADHLQGVCEGVKDELLGQDELTTEAVARRDRLQELIAELDWFIEDYRDPESATTWVVDADEEGVTIKPMDPERYLSHTVWDRANKHALLSATILNKAAFCRSVGLDPSTVALVDVEHTFPVANRPLYDVTQGKMTYENRAQTLPKLADTVVRVMATHPDEKGIVHAHSYDIAEKLAARLADAGVGDRVRTHDADTRDAELERWKASDDPEVFVAVKMEEALDLAHDLGRWQVLCKAPFLNTNDSRVAARLADGQWAWYYRTALQTIIQACGRVVRAPDDYGATYIADSSVLDVFERARGDMPPWFAAQVDAMTTPDLAEPDPAAALGETTAGVEQVEAATRSTDTGGRGSTGETQPDRAASRDDRDSEGSPVADVWNTE